MKIYEIYTTQEKIYEIYTTQEKIYEIYIMQGGEHSDSWGEPSHKSNSRLLEAHRLLWVLFSNFKLTLYTEPFQFSEEYVES